MPNKKSDIKAIKKHILSALALSLKLEMGSERGDIFPVIDALKRARIAVNNVLAKMGEPNDKD